MIKKNIKQFYIKEWSERRREVKGIENFYYASIYDILKDNRPPEGKVNDLNCFRAKIVQ